MDIYVQFYGHFSGVFIEADFVWPMKNNRLFLKNHFWFDLYQEYSHEYMGEGIFQF